MSCKSLINFKKVIDRGDLIIDSPLEGEEVAIITKSLIESDITDPIERGVTALLAYHGYTEPEEIEEIIEEEQEGELTIFSHLVHPSDSPPLLASNPDEFSAPLLLPSQTRNDIGLIERLFGRQDKQANNIASEVIRDLQTATFYPPETVDQIDASELASIVMQLNQTIQAERQKVESSESVD